MSHITQEQAIELARGAELDWHAGYLLDDERDNRYHTLCNAAIEWHIAQQAASVDATFKKPFATMQITTDLGATFSGIPSGTTLQAGDTFVMYKKDQKTNTSQERVYETAKSVRAPLTQEQIYNCHDRAAMTWVRPPTVSGMVAFAREIEKAHGIGGKL